MSARIRFNAVWLGSCGCHWSSFSVIRCGSNVANSQRAAMPSFCVAVCTKFRSVARQRPGVRAFRCVWLPHLRRMNGVALYDLRPAGRLAELFGAVKVCIARRWPTTSFAFCRATVIFVFFNRPTFSGVPPLHGWSCLICLSLIWKLWKQ